MTTFKPSPKDFNLMVLGQVVSILGSALLRFALSLYVLDITGQEDVFATLYAISSIPLLLSPLGGAIADRFNRRNLMVIFDFTSSSIVLCLILFMAAGSTSVALIGVIMVLLSVISSLYTPAVTASVPLLVEESKLEGANGIVQAVQALSQVAAPILGGNLVLSPLLIVGGPIILRVTMQSNDTMYGVGLGLINFASILGVVLIGAFAKKMRVNTVYIWIIAITLLLLPIAVSVMPFMLGLGYYPSYILFMLGAIPITTVTTILSIYIITKVQRVTPNENLGKVMAIIVAVAQCAAPLGQILYGVIFKSFSAALYLPVLAVSLIMLVIAFISQRILRNEGEPA